MSAGEGSSRRSVLGLLGAWALAPLLVPAGARAAGGAGPIQPPMGPMLFTRILTREMAGGHAVIATREFEVQFAPMTDGYEVNGAQISAHVDAPASLVALARLEEERIETGLFPMELDGDGRITACPDHVPSPSLAKAVDIALDRISSAGVSGDEKAMMQAFVLNLQKATASLVSRPPVDLFTPPAALNEVARDILLPDGSTGSVSTRFSGTITAETGLLDSAERVIVTRMEGTERRTMEQWALAPI